MSRKLLEIKIDRSRLCRNLTNLNWKAKIQLTFSTSIWLCNCHEPNKAQERQLHLKLINRSHRGWSWSRSLSTSKSSTKNRLGIHSHKSKYFLITKLQYLTITSKAGRLKNLASKCLRQLNIAPKKLTCYRREGEFQLKTLPQELI